MAGDSEWGKGKRCGVSLRKWRCPQSWAGGVDPVSKLGRSPLLFPAQLLCLLGESFEEYSGEVCGAVVNIRTKGDKIALWTSEAENKAGVMHIG